MTSMDLLPENPAPGMLRNGTEGWLLKEVEGLSFDNIDAPLGKVVSARHQDLLEVNKTALKLGYDY